MNLTRSKRVGAGGAGRDARRAAEGMPAGDLFLLLLTTPGIEIGGKRGDGPRAPALPSLRLGRRATVAELQTVCVYSMSHETPIWRRPAMLTRETRAPVG